MCSSHDSLLSDQPVIGRSPSARPDFHAGARPVESPEDSGIYECPSCGERERFVGIDAHGAGGPDFCNCDRPGGEHTAACEVFADVELVQPFTVVEQDGTPGGANVSYDSFDGGGSGAEIGTYSSISCARCGALVWASAEDHETSVSTP